MNKQPATFDDQMRKLRERGCEISDEEFCKRVLAKVNYYRLSAYFLTYKQSDGNYLPDTSFEKAYRNLPKLPDGCATDKLFGAVYALHGLFLDKQRWKSEFMPSLSALIDEYSDVIDLGHIGFPNEWKVVLA